VQAGQTPVILHLGDHDPSGIDMSRDIEERVGLFMDGTGDSLQFERIALNMDQVTQYEPPPNPAKATDARYQKYVDLHGDECWELDALEPSILDALIEEKILGYRDQTAWDDALAEQGNGREQLRRVASNWDKIVKNV
jgi:hypothetical protein